MQKRPIFSPLDHLAATSIMIILASISLANWGKDALIPASLAVGGWLGVSLYRLAAMSCSAKIYNLYSRPVNYKAETGTSEGNTYASLSNAPSGVDGVFTDQSGAFKVSDFCTAYLTLNGQLKAGGLVDTIGIHRINRHFVNQNKDWKDLWQGLPNLKQHTLFQGV